jgi:hypothetical protein
MKSPKPYSTGRIVIYIPTEADFEILGSGTNRTSPWSAIIAHSWPEIEAYAADGVVNLQVVTDGPKGLLWRTSVHYSDQMEPGTWHWPEVK